MVNGVRSGLVRQGLWRGAGGFVGFLAEPAAVCALVLVALGRSDGGFKQDCEK